MSSIPWARSGALILAVGCIIAFELTTRAAPNGPGDLFPGWEEIDVGATSFPGSVLLDASGACIVTGAGGDIGGAADAFHYFSEPMDGNGEVVARLLAVEGTNRLAKLGLMLRESGAPGARNAMVMATTDGNICFASRLNAGSASTRSLAKITATGPVWMKMVRSGDWVGGYISTDGTNWKLVGWQIFNGLAPTAGVGLAVADGHGAGITSAAFDHMRLSVLNAREVLFPAAGTGDGLRGEYFDNRHLFGVPMASKVAPEVDFGFAESSILASPKKDEFGVRWTGEIQAQFTETYNLSVETDDGVRVWLNEQLVVDDWSSHSNREYSTTINLVAGRRYLVRIEYFQNHGGSRIRLAWSSASTPKVIIPSTQLYSQPTDADGNGLADIWEEHYFGKMGVNRAADADGDGLSNLQEYQLARDPTSSLFWGLPNKWTHGDIENRGYSDSSDGGATFSDGVFTVSSKGREIWQRVDDFHYVYQPLATNGEMVVRVLGMDGINPQAKAGLMVRETLDNSARNFLVGLSQDKNIYSQSRTTAGDITARGQVHTNAAAISWLKVVRNNDWIGGYVSIDGTNWLLYDWQTLAGLPAQVFGGMFVTAQSHKGTRNPSTTVQFDQARLLSASSNEMMNPAVGQGDGLLAGFRNDSLLYLPGVTNFVDGVIDFNWIHNAAVKTLNPDYYGVCWQGEVEPQFTEPYSFSLQCRAENWARVWINDQLVIDGWRTLHPDIKFNQTGTINLRAGQRYLIRIEMFNDHGKGMARVKWKSPSTPERLVPQSQLYSQPRDTDRNGLPDAWEILYFGQVGVDPNADADSDGLSNLQEYQLHTNPTKPDTDNDGTPDAWEIAHGLDPQFNDAGLDYDGAGWSNLQKFLYGLDPFNVDVNNDGLPDSFEVRYLGLDVTTSHADLTSLAAVAYGAQGTNLLGSWQVDGTDIYSLDRRGGLDFRLWVTNADKYVLNLTGTQNQPNPLENQFKLLLGIDNQALGHRTLTAGHGTNGAVELVLPYLTAGMHTVHVFWDGVAGYSSLRIKQVKFLAVAGADANHNGMKDWADKMVADESGLDQADTFVGSYTSPACVEGRDPYPLMMSLTDDQTNSFSPIATTDGRWYVNVPLSMSTEIVIQASYQNQALIQGRQLKWLQGNLLSMTNDLTIRAGDSLWLTALPAGATSGNVQISYGTNVYSGKAVKGVTCKFAKPGTYSVSGTYSASSGGAQSRSILVKVVQQNLPNVPPATWTGMQRRLNIPGLAPEAELQVDARLSCSITGTNANGGTQLTLGTSANEESTMLTRLGVAGPVLDSIRESGFDVWSGNQAETKILQTYPDGSQLVQMLLISSPVETNVTFVLEPIVSGVIFEDGTATKTLTATNFDALGQCLVRFIRPASAHTSVCHQIKAYQGNYQVGYRH